MADVQPLFQHILAPTDGSQPALQAGKMAVRMAALHQCKLTFVYVVDDSVAGELAGTSKKDPKEVERELEQSGQHSLDYLCRLASEAGLDANQVIRRGDPCDEITKEAERERSGPYCDRSGGKPGSKAGLDRMRHRAGDRVCPLPGVGGQEKLTQIFPRANLILKKLDEAGGSRSNFLVFI